ncbi:MAG TPA: hypothetical protein VN764_18275, partial [Polyangiaceae bacterium]|nr:hypothetical protein [Polyangiaceae bacterium]
VVTHEYGHFALCDLANQLEPNAFATATRTFDAMLFTGQLDAEDESRTINEAFADFFVYQVVGGVSYVRFFENVKEGYFKFNFAWPGLDRNRTRADWETRYSGFHSGDRDYFTINWLASILQDVYDGHPKSSLAPTKGQSWAQDAATGLLVIDTSDHPDREFEQVALSGEYIKNFAQFFFDNTDGGGGYRYDAFEKGVVDTLNDADIGWCQQCLLLVDNYVGSDVNDVKQRLEQCTQGHLAELLGVPPHPIDRMDASCNLCDPWETMAYDGTCQPCGPDLDMDWAASGVGCDERTSVANLPPIAGDRCPDDFFVAIQNVNTATGVALETVETSLALQSLPPAAVCSEQSVGISVRAGTAAAGPLTELGP